MLVDNSIMLFKWNSFIVCFIMNNLLFS